jgi:hypothetical protein
MLGLFRGKVTARPRGRATTYGARQSVLQIAGISVTNPLVM